jgi:hypothetical protein
MLSIVDILFNIFLIMNSLKTNLLKKSNLVKSVGKSFSAAEAHKPITKASKESMSQKFHNIYIRELERLKQSK